ncbi:hypothetical protein GCM10012287_22280 [Streptomyces daqingensis]|uniref:Aminoglycoside phosphotransferase domain-containing protein n=2 Tax=Streptomyces daqingensis TaxID=1472640 RepID=A0ABQ2M8F0_9ACTN|nr:hypothetical protein GCM10012287_22280 [Streptomyces daqingensis]
MGGTHAVTHLLETAEPAREMVLQRFPRGDDAAARHAAALTALDGLDGRTPRLLDADPRGRRFGEPALLISRLPGSADIMSVSPDGMAVQLGRMLAQIHAVPLERFGGLRDGVAAAAASAGGSGGPAAAVLAAHGHRLADQPPVLTHYDFWAGNVLWREGRVTGVIDWSGASLAPRGFDVSWCRFDMVLLHGPSAADVFLKAYEEAAEETVPDMELWDLSTMARSRRTVETWHPNYRDLGRTDLTGAVLRRSHTEWTGRCLASWGRAERPRL